MAEKKSIYKSGKRNPNGYYSNKKKHKEKIIIACTIVFLVFTLIMTILDKTGVYSWADLKNDIGIISGPVNPDSDFTVYFLDIGQGDCTVIKSGDFVMMIDTGVGNNVGKIYESMTSLEIDSIDYLVITHQHEDHMGSAVEVIERYKVKNIIMPKLSEINMVTTVKYENLLKTIANNQVNAIPATVGNSFTLGDATVQILSPSKQYEDLNNMSIVLKVEFGDTSFLFQGDAEKDIEKELLNSNFSLEADVIKLGHHGSNTSSTDKYLNAVNPEYAIISCGIDNSYGHPHTEVIKRLHSNKINYYTTALAGDITITSDGQNIQVVTQKDVKVNYFEGKLFCNPYRKQYRCA